MITVLLAFASSILGGYLLVKLGWWYYKLHGKTTIDYLPGDIPILGHTLMVKNREYVHSMKNQWFQDFGNTFGVYTLSGKIVFTRDTGVCEELMASQKYLQKGWGYWILEKFLGKGLVVSYGDLWKQRRRLITPAFHFNILNDFASIMENKTLELVEYLQKHADKGLTFDAFKVTKPYSMSIICETAMGIDMSLEETSGGRFNSLYDSAIIILFQRVMRPWLKSDWIYSFTETGKKYLSNLKELRQFVRDVVEKRIEVRKNPERFAEGVSKRKIFIDILLDAYEKKEIDVEGILDEVNTFVNAGFETTSTALAWSLYCLGRNKNVQDKLYNELSSHRKSYSLQLDDFKEMKYLNLVIKETLRLHPPVTRISRSVREGTKLGSRVFPKCALIADILSMGRNPEVWDDPLCFLPDRFEKTRTHSLFAYIPFSAGPRNCIGQRFAVAELRIALYHLIGQFEVTSTQMESELEETFDITNGCKNGLMLRLKRRANSQTE